MEGEGRSIPLATNEKNPMVNHVVLARLFELCELSDLFRFRLVSKQWFSLSLPRFRHEVPLQNGLQWRCLDHKKQPVRCFHLSNVKFLPSPYPWDWDDDGHIQKRRQQAYDKKENFWRKYGAQIWKLELTAPKIFCEEEFKKRIFENVPNLQELKLSLGHLIPRRVVEEDDNPCEENLKEQLNLKSLTVNFDSKHKLPLGWRSVFLHFPKIEKLEIDLGSGGMPSFIRMVDSLEELSEKQGCKNHIIKDIKIHHAKSGSENATERLLKLPHLKLDTLWLDIRGCDEGRRDGIIRTILRNQGATLKKLGILDYCGNLHYEEDGPYQPWAADFPFQTEPFSSLTEIELCGFSSPNFHFLEQTPNLKKLSFSDCYPNMIEETDWERVKNLTLPHLLHIQVNLYLSEEAVQILGKIMPNLKVLETSLHTPAFRAVCENMKSLRELSVTSYSARNPGEVIGDKGVTGIVGGCGGRLPNITDLQVLEKLEINTLGDLTDGAIWNGFLKLTKLRSLCVNNRFKKGTSAEALNELYARFPDSRRRKYI